MTTTEQTTNKAQHCPLPWAISERGNVIDAEENNVATDHGENAALIVRAVNHADKLSEQLKRLSMRVLQSDLYAHAKIETDDALDALRAYEAAQ